MALLPISFNYEKLRMVVDITENITFPQIRWRGIKRDIVFFWK